MERVLRSMPKAMGFTCHGGADLESLYLEGGGRTISLGYIDGDQPGVCENVSQSNNRSQTKPKENQLTHSNTVLEWEAGLGAISC